MDEQYERDIALVLAEMHERMVRDITFAVDSLEGAAGVFGGKMLPRVQSETVALLTFSRSAKALAERAAIHKSEASRLRGINGQGDVKAVAAIDNNVNGPSCNHIESPKEAA